MPKSALVDEDQDPHTKRAMKIQRYKDLNVSRAALFALQAMAARKRQVGPSDADESNNDEENERKIWTKQIAMAALQAVDQQDHLKKVSSFLLSFQKGSQILVILQWSEPVAAPAWAQELGREVLPI